MKMNGDLSYDDIDVELEELSLTVLRSFDPGDSFDVDSDNDSDVVGPNAGIEVGQCQSDDPLDSDMNEFGSFIHKDILKDIGQLLTKGASIECCWWNNDVVILFLEFLNEKFKLNNNLAQIAKRKELTGRNICFKTEQQLRELFENHGDVDLIKGYLDCWQTVLDFPIPPTDVHPDPCVAVPDSDKKCDGMDSDKKCDGMGMLKKQIDRLLPSPESPCSVDGCEPAVKPEQQPVVVFKRKRGRPRKPKPEIEPPKRRKKILRKFLMYHLHGGNLSYCLEWVDKSRGIFRFISKHKEVIATEWGRQKGNSIPMTYQKMARALRDYTRKGVMEHCRGKLHYKFCQGYITEYNNDPTIASLSAVEYASKGGV